MSADACLTKLTVNRNTESVMNPLMTLHERLIQIGSILGAALLIALFAYLGYRI